jgi:pyruvate dehydrogenase E1 component alpha subunit
MNGEKSLSDQLLLDLLSNMYLGRYFEERVQWLFSQGLVHGTTHLGIGEEATAAGSIAAFEPQDYVFGTHRGHAQALCKGIDVNFMMCEILAKANGVCKGRGGSMHIADPRIHYFGADGVLGTSATMACGAGLSIKKKNENNRIAVVFYGDGSSNEGAVFESLNLAAVWNLPVLFICTNNTYGMSTHISKVMKDTDISKRAYPFNIPSKTVDGNNVLEVYEAVRDAREYIVAGNGPMLIVENTYRISGHSKSDGNLYRTKEEIASWKEKCPIKQFREYLLGTCRFNAETLDKVSAETLSRIDAAEEFAKASPEPNVDDVYEDVYA